MLQQDNRYGVLLYVRTSSVEVLGTIMLILMWDVLRIDSNNRTSGELGDAVVSRLS